MPPISTNITDSYQIRGTAKKFLAAAHFLEILSTFETAGGSEGVSESTNAEKIKYAKWKAADIAKAFREGRKPTPGPAGGLEDEAVESQTPSISIAPAPDTPLTPPPSSSPSGIYRINSPPHLKLSSQTQPQTPLTPSIPPPVDSAYLNPDALSAVPQTPSNWSTVATPGTPDDTRYDPDDELANGSHAPTHMRKAWVSTEMEGRHSDSELEEDSTLNRSSILWAASSTPMIDGLTPPANEAEADGFDVLTPPAVPSALPTVELPHGFLPSAPSQPPSAGSEPTSASEGRFAQLRNSEGR